MIHWEISFFEHAAHHLANEACSPNNSNIILFHNDPPSDPFVIKKASIEIPASQRFEINIDSQTFDSAPPTGDSPDDVFGRPRTVISRDSGSSAFFPFPAVPFALMRSRRVLIKDAPLSLFFLYKICWFLLYQKAHGLKREKSNKKAAVHQAAASKRWFHSFCV